MRVVSECVGEEKLILGCGVPLGPSFGVVDACRIGCDVSPHFEFNFIDKDFAEYASSSDVKMKRSATSVRVLEPSAVGVAKDGIDLVCSQIAEDKERKKELAREIATVHQQNTVPSDITVKSLKLAKENGHRIWAKIQANNSWECAGVPSRSHQSIGEDHDRRSHG